MYLEVDPHGDTLIILQNPPSHPSSPSDTVKETASKNQFEHQFLVSKKHLMLASPRASKVFEGSFTEATPREDGLFRWKFEPIFDPKAFETVMKIIHGQTRDVPTKIDLTLLAQITAIVDDLECHNTLWFFAKLWLNQIKDRIPSEFCEDLMRWILISFVFEEPELFKKATTTAIEHGIDDIPTFNLPIRPRVLEDIEVKREGIFSNLLTLLYHLEEQLLDKSIGCNKGCRAMMLGTLSQGLRAASLSPSPSPPYISLSIRPTLRQLTATESLDYYCAEEGNPSQTNSGIWIIQKPPSSRKQSQSFWDQLAAENTPTKLVRHKCLLKDYLSELLDTTESQIKGLELANYLGV
ncbi:hypothetical protein H0G86_006890 [Trichoderma simmonsii]|uniref:BTB domain-containing protein n=1 Tax=Trichoderma simmonsii TaxID=1491479 RepID=A0A8G0LCE8_9HYPO|nr:hypothetical protein H0G86_006890 [Trichoderma simmonsii]